MCVFFPLFLLLVVGVPFLPAPLPFIVLVEFLLFGVLLILVARLRRRPTTVGGLTLELLTGRPCPACGSTATRPWMSGQTPLGLHCGACGRRTAGGA